MSTEEKKRSRVTLGGWHESDRPRPDLGFGQVGSCSCHYPVVMCGPSPAGQGHFHSSVVDHSGGL